METRDTEQKEITEKFINQAIEGHRAHDLIGKEFPDLTSACWKKTQSIGAAFTRSLWQ